MRKNYAGMALGKPGASTGCSEHATPAALPAPLCSRDFYEKVNPYWLQQAEMRKRARAQGHKRARLDKE